MIVLSTQDRLEQKVGATPRAARQLSMFILTVALE
jgi:hypothetical protein